MWCEPQSLAGRAWAHLCDVCPWSKLIVLASESAASQFAWVVPGDEAFQAKMVAGRTKRQGGGRVVFVQSALQVSTFIETLVLSVLHSITIHQKPTICFMTLDSHGQSVAITGTQLRLLLRAHSRACQLLQESKLFLVGLSGESVSDELLLVSLLKGARMNEVYREIIVAATCHIQSNANGPCHQSGCADE